MPRLGALVRRRWRGALPASHPPPARATHCSIPYFQEEYPAQKAGVAFYMTAAYIYPQLPLLGVMVGFGSRVAFRWRVVIPLLLQLAALVILPIVAPTSIWATLCIIFLVGLCTAVFQSSGFAFAR